MENGRIESGLNIAIKKKDISAIPERGLKDLLILSENYYNSGNKQIAVEKLWDAFERLKTYYSPDLNKAASANKIIDDMSGFDPNYQALYKAEFKTSLDKGTQRKTTENELPSLTQCTA